MEHYKVIILGSGPAGLTAAIYASRADLHPLVLGGYTPGGQLMLTTEVENYPGYISIMGPDLMQKMREQAKSFGTTFIDQDATTIDLGKRPFNVTSEEQQFTAEAVIIATGASARWLNVPGEQEFIGKGVSSCATCDGFFFRDKQVTVVGGGDSAMEEALFLTKFARQVQIVHRRSEFRASKMMQQKALHHSKIKVCWNSAITKVKGSDTVTSIIVQNTHDQSTAELPTDAVFVAIGHIPNTAIFKGQLPMDDQGYLTIHDETQTDKEGVFVAGDVFDRRYRQAVTAAGSGCKAAMDVEKYLQMHL